MRKVEKRCALCGGSLRRERRPYAFRGVRFGEFDFDVCAECGDVIVPKRTALSLEAFAKEHGLWGSSLELLHAAVPHPRNGKAQT